MKQNTSKSSDNHTEIRLKDNSELICTDLRLIKEDKSKIISLKKAINEGIESGIAKDFDAKKHLVSLKKNKMNKIIYLLLIAVLVSCTNLPNESEIYSDINKKVREESNNKVELLNCKKENAIEEEINGVKSYKIFYSAKIKYLENGFIKKPYFSDANFLNLYEKSPKTAFCQCIVYKVPKNTEVKINGIIKYLKTENGWQTTNDYITLNILKNKKQP